MQKPNIFRSPSLLTNNLIWFFFKDKGYNQKAKHEHLVLKRENPNGRKEKTVVTAL